MINIKKKKDRVAFVFVCLLFALTSFGCYLIHLGHEFFGGFFLLCSLSCVLAGVAALIICWCDKGGLNEQANKKD